MIGTLDATCCNKLTSVPDSRYRGVYPRGGELGEQSPTFLKVGVEGMVISTNLWRLDRQSDGYAKIGDK